MIGLVSAVLGCLVALSTSCRRVRGGDVVFDTKRELVFVLRVSLSFYGEYGMIPHTPEILYEEAMKFSKGGVPARWVENGRAVDYWGSPYVVIGSPQEFKAWSVGPNGVDERGAGDDILMYFTM